MYLLISGTTDHYTKLKAFLKGIPHTFIDGSGEWNSKQLSSQVILFFKKDNAKTTRDFLINVCNQKQVPIFKIKGKFL